MKPVSSEGCNDTNNYTYDALSFSVLVQFDCRICCKIHEHPQEEQLVRLALSAAPNNQFDYVVTTISCQNFL